MTVADGYGWSRLRILAALGAVAMVMSLWPLSGTAAAQEDPANDCPVEAPEAEFPDRETMPAEHVRNVDCAAFLDIVSGFEDGRYGARLAVRRDQMATFIARALTAAGVTLPAGQQDQFTDVTGGPHRVNINRLALAGIVQGGPGDLPDDQYGAEHRTRRDQMASFLMRAAGYAYFDDPNAFRDIFNTPEDQVFEDVPSTNAHYGNVNAASVGGLAQGFEGGLFQPRQSTRRDQMASFVVRLLNFLAIPTSVEITGRSPETGTVGESMTVTATVRDHFDRPAQDQIPVSFRADTAPTQTQDVTTDANSQARFRFTSF